MSRIMHEISLQAVCDSRQTKTKSLGSPPANNLFCSLQFHNKHPHHPYQSGLLNNLRIWSSIILRSHHTSLRLARTFRFTFLPDNMVSVELEKPVQVVVRIEIPTEAQLIQRRKPRTATWITHSVMSLAEYVAP